MNENNSIFTIRTALRAFALFCIIVVFCPTFMVSCGGQTLDISAMSLVTGIKVNGEVVSQTYPYMLIFLILPVVMFAFLMGKKSEAQKTALYLTLFGAVDLVLWFIFKTNFYKEAEENYFNIRTTNWYLFNNFSLIAIILLSVLVLLRKIHMDKSLLASS